MSMKIWTRAVLTLLAAIAGESGCSGSLPVAETAQAVRSCRAIFSPTTGALGECGALLPPDGAVATILVDLGPVSTITDLEQSGDRILSREGDRWILWDRTTRTQVSNGVATGRVQLVASTLLVLSSTTLELRSAVDGQLLSSVQADITGLTVGLTGDGLNAWATNALGITVWDLSGQSVASASGDYSRAQISGTGGELRIGRSPSHADAIEVFDLSSGSLSVTPSFSGTFLSWFLDGERFFTNLSTTVWIYSKSAIQQEIISLPSTVNLTGQLDYFWMGRGRALDIYRVGGGPTPVATYPVDGFTRTIGIGNKIGILPYGTPGLDIVSLDPSKVTRTSYEVSLAYLTAFGSDGENWTVGNSYGAIFESSSGLPLNYGQVWSIAGADTGTAAVTTASGNILMFSLQPSGHTFIGSIDFPSSHVELSSDGTVLAAKGNTGDDQYWTDRSVKVFAIPDLIETANWPHSYSSYPTLFFEFGLSRSGDHLAHLEGTWNGDLWTYSRMLTDIQGTVTYFRDTNRQYEIYKLSPNGSRFALNNAGAAQLFEEGTLVGAVAGNAAGWLDDDRILVNVIMGTRHIVSIYNSQGTLLSRPPLPDGWPRSFNVVSPTRIHVQSVDFGPLQSNTIYDLETGASVWSQPSASQSAVAGAFIVYSQGARIIAEQFPTADDLGLRPARSSLAEPTCTLRYPRE